MIAVSHAILNPMLGCSIEGQSELIKKCAVVFIEVAYLTKGTTGEPNLLFLVLPFSSLCRPLAL